MNNSNIVAFKDVKRTIRIMKTTLFLLIIGFSQTATIASSQNIVKLTLSVKNEPLGQVMQMIEKQSDYLFFYNSNEVNKEIKISVDKKDCPIDEILNEVTKNTSLSWSIQNRHIVLTKKAPAPVPQPGQKNTVKGTVLDDINEPLPGATIKTSAGKSTVTDLNGRFSIEANPEEKITVSFISFEEVVITVDSRKTYDIVMRPQENMLDELVVVGFGKQKKSDLVGSVSSINVSDLKKVSSSNMTTMMAGNIAGMISYQRSGEPGADNADFFIRGVTTFGYKKDPLILIDGIEVSSTDLARLQPDDIANFSIMKDATSTAVYGARGANGVILITTKEGKEGKMSISVRFENAFSKPTRNIELADPITYMRLGNEAVLTRNPLGILPYSKSKIDNTLAGINPVVYPATDWQRVLFKDYATNQRVNLNASGGGKVAQYYLTATFNQDNGVLNVDKRNNFNSNINLKTYSIRSNVNFNLTNTTKATLRVSGTFDDYTGPVEGGTEIYNMVMHSNPVLFPAYYEPDASNLATKHILFGNYGKANYINPYANQVRGYKDYSRSKVDAQFELKQDFSFWLKGLSLRALFNTSRNSYFDVVRGYSPFYYNIGSYDKETGEYTLAALNETSGTEYLGYYEGDKQVSSSTYLEFMANYDRTFAKKHAVSAMMVYILRNSITGNAGDLQRSLPFRNMGLSGRATYSFDNRYFGEFNFGYNGSERFYKTNRFGFFPSAGVAWNISNEAFWASLARVVSKLKLRATYGLVGNDAIGNDYDRFFYLSNVNMDDGGRGATFGTYFSYNRPGVSISRYANQDISWEKARKTNLGVEVSLFNKFNIEADYFTENRTNILMNRASIPSTMGLSAGVKANVGEAKSRGIDGSIDYAESFGRYFWIKARANFTFATSEFIVYEEPHYKEGYLSHVGKSLSQEWGYIAERLFVDEAEVSNSPRQNFGLYGAGDIKYRDVNGDGQITELDRVPIGYPTSPEIMYGFGVSLGYKNIDFSCFFQGSGRSSFWIDPRTTSPFNNETQLLKAYAESYWSEDNRDLYALWPRLSSTINENNAQQSTWFMRDGSFLRLKSLEVGYTLPAKWMSKLRLSNARIYVNGTNLFCLSKFKLWDPEMGGNGLGYPVQVTFNTGINISF